MRPLRVKRLNANWSGGSPQCRGTSSKYSALWRAASWKRSTTGRRSSSYSTSASPNSSLRPKQAASSIASSIASLVPDPIEKCAVCAASPSSTVAPALQSRQRSSLKASHTERFDSSSCPSSTPANSSRQNARLSCSDNSSSPARCHVSARVSTMNVLVPSSNGYACAWNTPCSVSTNANVNASSATSVPNQANRVGYTSTCGPKASSRARRTSEL